MKNKKLLLLVFAILLLSLLLAACSGFATPTATLTPKPTVTGPGGFPVGIFKPDHVLWTQYILFNAQGTFVLQIG